MTRFEGEVIDQLRVPPLGRLAGASRMLDLSAELMRLRAGEQRGRNGHRQVTLFHRTPVSLVLFSFDAGGTLPRHSANGLVTIEVLQGRLIVEADGRDHELRMGQMLVLNPNVAHAVHAVQTSAMLLTIHMEDCP